MGQPKLMLPLGGKTVIERVLEALDHPAIIARCVVVRDDDIPLKETVLRAGAFALSPPVDPPDMRASVLFALQEIQQMFAPQDDDGWLLVPADHPVLDRDLIESLIEHWAADHPTILVPRCGDRRGHPTIFRWSLAQEVARIPPDRGLNRLLQTHASAVTEVAVDSASALLDLDTPEDYARLCESWTPTSPTN